MARPLGQGNGKPFMYRPRKKTHLSLGRLLLKHARLRCGGRRTKEIASKQKKRVKEKKGMNLQKGNATVYGLK